MNFNILLVMRWLDQLIWCVEFQSIESNQSDYLVLTVNTNNSEINLLVSYFPYKSASITIGEFDIIVFISKWQKYVRL